jgi:hypothetical protein
MDMNLKLLLYLALVLSGGLNCPAAITHPKAPEGGKQIVEKYLDPQLLKPLGITNAADLTIADPFVEYAGGELTPGKFLSTAQLFTWRYPLMQGTNVVGAIELRANEKLKFVSLGKTLWDNSTPEAIRKAEQLPQVKRQDYELRCLGMIPYYPAIWLHGESNDIIIPLPNRWVNWRAFQPNLYQPYSENEILGILKPIVERKRAAWAKLNLNPPGPTPNDVNVVYIKAMTDYEKAHGGKCGSISFTGMSGPFQRVSSHAKIFTLQGVSSECGKLSYKVKVTYEGLFDDVKKVEILEKITQ